MKGCHIFLLFCVIYSCVILSAYLSHKWLTMRDATNSSPILNLFYADLVASLVVFIFCIAFNSFSINDQFWTVQSSVFSLYFGYLADTFNLRLYLVILLLNVWSFRLLSNFFLNGIPHISYEDWHYSIFRPKFKSKMAYFGFGLVSFILMPAILVFFGCMPLYYIAKSDEPFNSADIIATLIVLVAIVFEGVADSQLRNNNRQNTASTSARPCMDKGLWSLCRHPNYFGEVSFWFGLYAFGLAAGASIFADMFYALVFFLGPFAIFSMIFFGSLPMMEERQLKRRKEFYKGYMKRVPFKILPLNFLFAHQQNRPDTKLN